MNKKVILYIIITIIIILGGGLFMSFPIIINYFVEQKIKNFPKLKYDKLIVDYSANIILTNLIYERSNIIVNIDSIVVIPDYKDVIIKRKLVLNTIKVYNGIIKKTKIDSDSSTNEKSINVDSSKTFLQKANVNYQKFKKFIQFLPHRIIVKSFSVNYGKYNIKLQSLANKGNTIYGKALFNNDTVNITLALNPKTRTYEFNFYSKNNITFNIKNSKNFILLQKIKINIKENEDKTYIKTNLYKVKIKHKKLAEDTTELDSIGFDGSINVTKNKLQIDGPAHFFFNKYNLYGSLLYKISPTDSTLIFKVRTDTTEAQFLLSQIPESFKNYIQGMKLQGKIAFDTKILVQLGKEDKADIKVKPYLKNFKILEYGKSDLSKLNGEFEHRPYKSFRIIYVGEKNPYYTPYEEISPYLIDAVLTSEDGYFFKHKGFNVKALKQSLITNLRRGKFVRGGSTITMQLIKNVFLTHKKTISRKFQEILLTWLLEHFRIVPKKRLLEVYLNIIEWGPNVYGIGEAAEFYFMRKPKDLPPNEAIFLAMIIPRPKKFYIFFDENNRLKPFVEYYYEKVGKFMIKHGVLEEWQFNKLFPPKVWIIGEARKYLPLYKKYHPNG